MMIKGTHIFMIKTTIHSLHMHIRDRAHSFEQVSPDTTCKNGLYKNEEDIPRAIINFQKKYNKNVALL